MIAKTKAVGCGEPPVFQGEGSCPHTLQGGASVCHAVLYQCRAVLIGAVGLVVVEQVVFRAFYHAAPEPGYLPRHERDGGETKVKESERMRFVAHGVVNCP